MTGLRDFLERLVAALESQRFAYMFVGSMASTAHGPPRSTQDVDLVVSLNPADAARLVSLFPDHAYYLSEAAVRDAIGRRTTFNLIDFSSGWKADFMVEKARPFSAMELSRRMRAEVLGVKTWVATPEDTLLAKLEWSRIGGGSARQLEDVAGILATQGSKLDFDYIERWAPTLGVVDEWRRLRAEIP